MLQRKIATDLLEQYDNNARVTVFNKNLASTEEYKKAWIQELQNMISCDITNPDQQFLFFIRKANQTHSYIYTATLSKLMEKLNSLCQIPTSIRISDADNPDRPWILLIY